ncbi:MAG: D-alanyl-D-alanine carboxypeptidase/D-alanyl-D-alanine-endopeptidase [Acidobacteria bacterium]|nr:D-alanyl-D-alanine carboxypeptidase/D-alanyl-D-alanine-endopeptidase [Acidobacteriota bacterium]
MTNALRLLGLSLLIITTGCFSAKQQAEEVKPVDPTAADTAAFDVPVPNINLTNPLVVSTRPDDVAMCSEINDLIDKSPYANAHWGVIVVSLKDGRVACSRDGRKLFNPASIQKTLVAMVALDKLGPDYRWKTTVLSGGNIGADGTLDGDLVLHGEGAPDFDNEALENLAGQLQAAGLKRVRGAVVGDAGYFRGETIGAGWTWNELQWYYGAEASALTFNDNQAFVNVENGVGKTSTDYIRATVGTPTPIPNANNQNVYEEGGVRRGLADNDFYVWGSSKNFGMRVAVHDPAKWAAKSLRESLERKGITVEGETRSRDWRTEDGFQPEKARELARVESQPLAEIVRRMNKRSINLYAELLLRTLGKKFGTEVPANIQLPESVRGDDTAGAALVKKWLLEHRIAADEMQIADGSGLSRLDFVTPESFARAFIAAARAPFAQVFTDSLPVAATDGTLGGRLALAKGKVLAKTGTVTYVNSLAGYAQNKSGEVFTFAVIANNDTHRNGAVGMIDRIVLRIAGIAPDEKPPADANVNANTNANISTKNFVTNSVN